MSSYIFDQVKGMVATGALRLVDGDGQYKLALMDSTLLDSAVYSGRETWDQVDQYEITNVAGYNSEGYEQGLLNAIGTSEVPDAGTTCDDGLPDYMVFATNITYPVSRIDADCAVITRTRSGTGNIIQDGDDLIAVLDLQNDGATVSSNQGVFTIQLNADSGGYLIVK